MPRRILVSLAFATWCFLGSWLALTDSHRTYFLRKAPLGDILPALAASEAMIAVAMLSAWEVCPRIRGFRMAAERLFLVACAVPSGIAATVLASQSPTMTRIIQSRRFWPAAAVVLLFPIVYAARRPARCGRSMRSFLLWSWPVLAMIMLEAAWTTFRYPSRDYADSPAAARVASVSKVRVVWVIFDELSQSIAFRHRPRGLELASFDRLKNESFYATAAVAPGDATIRSLPSLILGERVVGAELDGPADLRIQTRSNPQGRPWESFANVFDSARAAGFNTAIVGWYHPYGRLLNRSVTECFWTPSGIDPGAEETLDSAIADRAWLAISNLPLAGRIPRFSSLRYDRLVRIRDFVELKRRALDVVGDPAIGLTLIHLPAPHPPGIYDRATGMMDAVDPDGYLDNVALADRTLSELRQRMEQAELWDRTAVILSSDHGWRTRLWRGTAGWTPEDERVAPLETEGVPFLVKLPGSSEGATYDARFDTVVTRDIVQGVLEQRVTTAHELGAMIEQSSQNFR